MKTQASDRKHFFLVISHGFSVSTKSPGCRMLCSFVTHCRAFSPPLGLEPSRSLFTGTVDLRELARGPGGGGRGLCSSVHRRAKVWLSPHSSSASVDRPTSDTQVVVQTRLSQAYLWQLSAGAGGGASVRPAMPWSRPWRTTADPRVTGTPLLLPPVGTVAARSPPLLSESSIPMPDLGGGRGQEPCPMPCPRPLRYSTWWGRSRPEGLRAVWSSLGPFG